MEIIKNFLERKQIPGQAFITIGTFDGVHLGHRKVIGETAGEAKQTGGRSMVITFDPHPRSILETREHPPLLTSTEHKINLLSKFNINKCLVIKFNHQFADITAETFIDLLQQKLDLKGIVLGNRTRFGRNQEGNAELVQALGRKHRFRVKVITPVTVEGTIVSSTLIRKYVHAGELELAAGCLGRKFSIMGSVTRGDTIGRRLGYPTANIDPHNEVIPPSGVYAVRIILDDRRCDGILNIGYRPTIKDANRVEQAVEVYIFDFDRMIYGKTIEVVFEQKIREEKKFTDTSGLIEQIKRDEMYAKRFFADKP